MRNAPGIAVRAFNAGLFLEVQEIEQRDLAAGSQLSMQHRRADEADPQPANHSYQSQSAPADVKTEWNTDRKGQRSSKVFRPAHRDFQLLGEEIPDPDIEAGPDKTADRIQGEKGGGGDSFGSRKWRHEAISPGTNLATHSNRSPWRRNLSCASREHLRGSGVRRHSILMACEPHLRPSQNHIPSAARQAKTLSRTTMLACMSP